MSTTARRPPARTPHLDRGAVTRWAVGTALVTVAVLVAVLLAGGGAPQPVPAGIVDAGPVTGWGLPVIRLLADLAGIATVGLLLAAALLLPSPGDRLADEAARCARLAARTGTVWLVAVLGEAVLTLSDILGTPAGQVLDPVVLRSFLGQIPQGRALLVQAALTVVVAILARTAATPRHAAGTVVFALAALTPPALTGHSSSAGSHELAVASLLVHVLAAGLWVGGLAALAWTAAATRSGDSGILRYAVPRFSTLAAWCFTAVALSGAGNAAVRLGGITPLVTTPYGALVLGKVTALGMLGGFGWWHRHRTVPLLTARTPSPGGRRDAARLFLSVASAELVVMCATLALAVGLSRTPTPVHGASSSPAANLLGFPLPPVPTLSRVAFGWVADGFALTFVVVVTALYAAGVHALRRRGDTWPIGRTFSWYAGLVVFAWATIGGLGLYSHVLFSAHMVAHMLLSMVVPIGLVLGAPLTLALRALPGPRVPGELGPRQLLLAALHSRPVRLLSHPLVAFGVFVGGLYALYFTALFPTLMRNHLGHVAMEFHFLAAGCLFFWVLVGVDPTPRQLHPLARIGLLFVAMPFHAFFSIAVMSAGTVLAESYYRTLSRPYAPNLAADQNLGGGIGWALGELPILLVLCAVFVQWVRADRREADRLDRAADRAASGAASGAADRAAGRGTASSTGGASGDELDRYNAYLAALAAHDARHDRSPTRRRHPKPRRNHEGTTS